MKRTCIQSNVGSAAPPVIAVRKRSLELGQLGVASSGNGSNSRASIVLSSSNIQRTGRTEQLEHELAQQEQQQQEQQQTVDDNNGGQLGPTESGVCATSASSSSSPRKVVGFASAGNADADDSLPLPNQRVAPQQKKKSIIDLQFIDQAISAFETRAKVSTHTYVPTSPPFSAQQQPPEVPQQQQQQRRPSVHYALGDLVEEHQGAVEANVRKVYANQLNAERREKEKLQKQLNDEQLENERLRGELRDSKRDALNLRYELQKLVTYSLTHVHSSAVHQSSTARELIFAHDPSYVGSGGRHKFEGLLYDPVTAGTAAQQQQRRDRHHHSRTAKCVEVAVRGGTSSGRSNSSKTQRQQQQQQQLESYLDNTITTITSTAGGGATGSIGGDYHAPIGEFVLYNNSAPSLATNLAMLPELVPNVSKRYVSPERATTTLQQKQHQQEEYGFHSSTAMTSSSPRRDISPTHVPRKPTTGREEGDTAAAAAAAAMPRPRLSDGVVGTAPAAAATATPTLGSARPKTLDVLPSPPWLPQEQQQVCTASATATPPHVPVPLSPSQIAAATTTTTEANNNYAEITRTAIGGLGDDTSAATAIDPTMAIRIALSCFVNDLCNVARRAETARQELRKQSTALIRRLLDAVEKKDNGGAVTEEEMMEGLPLSISVDASVLNLHDVYPSFVTNVFLNKLLNEARTATATRSRGGTAMSSRGTDNGGGGGLNRSNLSSRGHSCGGDGGEISTSSNAQQQQEQGSQLRPAANSSGGGGGVFFNCNPNWDEEILLMKICWTSMVQYLQQQIDHSKFELSLLRQAVMDFGRGKYHSDIASGLLPKKKPLPPSQEALREKKEEFVRRQSVRSVEALRQKNIRMQRENLEAEKEDEVHAGRRSSRGGGGGGEPEKQSSTLMQPETPPRRRSSSNNKASSFKRGSNSMPTSSCSSGAATTKAASDGAQQAAEAKRKIDSPDVSGWKVGQEG